MCAGSLQLCPTLCNSVDCGLPGVSITEDVSLGKNTGAYWPYLLPCPSSVQFSRSVVSNSANSWTAAQQVFLSFTTSWSLLMFVESVMPSNCLILYRPLLLLPSVFPHIRVFSSESVLHIRWPEYWSFSFSISPSNKYS